MSDINAQIEELFPELQGLLDSWETAPQQNNGSGFENENGIEPTEIEQAMQQRMAAMPQPQFQPGQTAPAPPAAHVEDGGPPVQPVSTPPASAQPGAAAEPAESAATTPSPSADEVTIGQDDDGNPITVPLARLQAYAQFDNEFQTDAGLREAVLNYYQGRTDVGEQAQPTHPPGEPVPAPTPSPTFPQPQQVPELDLEDPAIAFLVNQQQQLAEQVRMLAGGVQATVQQQQQRTAAKNDSLINRAMKSFKEQHSLDDQQMSNIRQAAARLNVVPSLLQGVDPITGAPSKPDPLAALDRAFEIAMMMSPEHRQREFAREIQTRVTNSRRKQKLAGLAGSSGSVPRTSPAPTTEQGRRQSMIDEIRQMQEGQWAAPES